MTMLRSRGWMLLVCVAAPAAAQDIDSFDHLVGLVEPGDGVRVTFRDGRERTARLVGVTPETLSVVTRGQQLFGTVGAWIGVGVDGLIAREIAAPAGVAPGAACSRRSVSGRRPPRWSCRR